MSVSIALEQAAAGDARDRINTGKVWGDAYIPALQVAGLERVPGWRVRPDLARDFDPVSLTTWQEAYAAEDPAWRSEAIAWQDEVVKYTEWVQPRCEASAREADRHARFAADDPNYFKALFCWIQEPRVPTKRVAPMKRFVPYHFQCHLTNRWLAAIDSPLLDLEDDDTVLDQWVPKSRQCGVTANNMMDKAWSWCTRSARHLIMARDQAAVYKRGDDGALFTKIVNTLIRLPPWYLARVAPGFDPNSYRWYKKNLLTNLHNGAQIVGSATVVNAARGDRFLDAELDEASEFRHLEVLLSSARGAARLVRLTGTEGIDVSREWLESWQTADELLPANVFQLNFHQNPRLDINWKSREELRFASPKAREQFAREYLRDPWAGKGEFVYPEARNVKAADRQYDPTLPYDIILDPAGTGDDMAALFVQPMPIEGHPGYHVFGSYQVRLPNPEWAAHVLTGIWAEPGDSCYPQRPSADEDKIGAFLFTLWQRGYRVRYFSDPAGDQMSTNTSYIKMLIKKMTELRARALARLALEHERAKASHVPMDDWPSIPTHNPVIRVMTDAMKKHRLLPDREFALRKYIGHITYQLNNPAALWAITCLIEHKYREQTDKMVTQPTVIHGIFSHIVSCHENYAIAYIYRWIDPPPRDTAPLHQPSLRGASASTRANGQPVPHRAPPNRGRPAPADFSHLPRNPPRPRWDGGS